MATSRRLEEFELTLAGQQAREELKAMTSSRSYNTTPSYSANSELHPGNKISFVEKHMAYLSEHPSTSPDMYLRNLRLKTKKRS